VENDSLAARFDLFWFGLVWFGLVWFGLVWFGLVWFVFLKKYIEKEKYRLEKKRDL
jgi:hypothetical protein